MTPIKGLIGLGGGSSSILVSSGETTLPPAPTGIYGPFPDTSTSLNASNSTNVTNIFFRRTILGFTYTYNEITANGTNALAGGGTINALSFYQTNAPVYRPLPNYAVAMMHMPSGSTSSTNPTLSGSGRADFTTVRSQHSFNPSSTNTYITISFSSNFVYDGESALGFIFAWGQCPTNYSSSGISRISNTGTMYYTWTDSAGTYLVTDTASSTRSYRPCLRLHVP
jgi:hypothetical protein